MKKALVLLLLLLLPVLCCTAAAETLGDPGEVAQFLEQCRASGLESFTFETTDALFERLTESDWAVLAELLRKSGVSGYAVNSRNTTFTFSDVTYLQGALFDCGSERLSLFVLRIRRFYLCDRSGCKLSE